MKPFPHFFFSSFSLLFWYRLVGQSFTAEVSSLWHDLNFFTIKWVDSFFWDQIIKTKPKLWKKIIRWRNKQKRNLEFPFIGPNIFMTRMSLFESAASLFLWISVQTSVLAAFTYSAFFRSCGLFIFTNSCHSKKRCGWNSWPLSCTPTSWEFLGYLFCSAPSQQPIWAGLFQKNV